MKKASKQEITEHEKEYCPFTQLIHFLSEKWIIIVIKSISDWCKSFSTIEKNLVWVNPRILSNRLKELQEMWFVKKKIISETPLKAIYCLTKKWESLSKHIDSISSWAKENMKK